MLPGEATSAEVREEWADTQGKEKRSAKRGGSYGQRGEAVCCTGAIYEYWSLNPKVILKAA